MDFEQIVADVRSALLSADTDKAVSILLEARSRARNYSENQRIKRLEELYLGGKRGSREAGCPSEAAALSRALCSDELARAEADYQAAIDAFSTLANDRGLPLLRSAQATIERLLGSDHWFSLQAKGVLAGRLRDLPNSASERLGLYLSLWNIKRTLFGDHDARVLRTLVDVAHLHAHLGQTEAAITAFENAFDGLFEHEPREAAKLLEPLFLQYAQIACDALIGAREQRCAEHPNCESYVTDLRKFRFPSLREAFEFAAVEHVAVHFEEFRVITNEVCVRRSRDPRVLVCVQERRGQAVEGSADDLFLGAVEGLLHEGSDRPDAAFLAWRAVEELEREARERAPDFDPADDHDESDPQSPSSLEFEWQRELFAKLWNQHALTPA